MDDDAGRQRSDMRHAHVPTEMKIFDLFCLRGGMVCLRRMFCTEALAGNERGAR
jgi:hypothetical protein